MIPAITDLHCHCLPGVDDGPAHLDGALALCRKLAEEGVTTVTATPHQLGRFEGRNDAPAIRAAVKQLNEHLAGEQVPLHVLPGGEVRLNADLPALLETDVVSTMGDSGRWVLLEFPDHGWLEISPLLQQLGNRGMRAIIAHPERYPWDQMQVNRLWQWRRLYHTQVQITAGSLLGTRGGAIADLCWHWLEHGLVDLVASDAHDVSRRLPRIRETWNEISKRLGESMAMRVLCQTPARLLAEQPAPAPTREKAGVTPS